MTGPEHYREAEKLLDHLKDVERGDPVEVSICAEAQVHATLALAAAAAANNPGGLNTVGQPESVAQEWRAIIMPAEGGEPS